MFVDFFGQQYAKTYIPWHLCQLSICHFIQSSVINCPSQVWFSMTVGSRNSLYILPPPPTTAVNVYTRLIMIPLINTKPGTHEHLLMLNCQERWIVLDDFWDIFDITCIWFFLSLQIRNKATSQCIDSMGRKSGEKVGLVQCHGMGGNQVSHMTSLFFEGLLFCFSSFHMILNEFRNREKKTCLIII